MTFHSSSSSPHGLRPVAWTTGLTGLTVVALSVFGSFASGYPDGKELRDLNTTLRKQAPAILAKLEERGYQNVGVLKFEVKINNRKPTMHSGRLNQQMATRVENALILVSDDNPTVGITRNAGETAMKLDKKATWRTAEGRAKLFNYKYPKAWGKESVKVNAFLTGIIELDSKSDVAKVTVQVFDNDKTKTPKEIAQFQAKLTSNLVAESGQRFVVKKRTIQEPGAPPIVEDDPVLPGDSTTINADQEFNKVVDFQINYDGTNVSLTPDASGSFKCSPPALNQAVSFKIKSTEKIGLVLFVNGVNTLKMARADSADVVQHYRWILEPNQDYTIEGFYPSFEKVEPFKAAGVGEVNPGELGPEDKWGLIELHVFRDAGANAGSLPPPPPNLEQSGPPELELRTLLTKLKKSPVAAKNLIIPDKLGQKDAKVQEASFNGRLAMSRTIMYFQKGEAGSPPQP